MNRAELEAAVERKRLMQAVEAKRAGATPAPAPVNSNAVYTPSPDPSLFEQAAHVAGGASETPFALMDLPSHAGKGLAWLGEKTGLINEPTQEWLRSHGQASELPYVKDVKHFLTDPFVEKDSAPVAEAGRTFNEWASGGLLSKAKNLSALPDILAGTGAVIGDQLAGETGEAAGGMLGIIAGLLRGKAPLGKDEIQAVDYVTDVLQDTPNAQAKLEKSLATDAAGTMADRTGNAKLYNVEETLGPKGSDLRGEIENIVTEMDAAARKEVSDVMPTTASVTPSKKAAEDYGERVRGDIEGDRAATVKQILEDDSARVAAAKSTETGMASELSELQARADALRKEADEYQGSLNTLPHPADASVNAADELARVDKAHSDMETAKWGKLEDSPPIDVSAAVNDLDPFIANLKMGKIEREAMQKTFKPEIDAIKAWGNAPVAPLEIQAVLRKMKEKISTSMKDGVMPYESQMAGEVVKHVEKMMAEVPTTNGLFRDAVAATVAKYDKARPEKMRQIRKSPNKETFVERTGLTGNEGANTARLIKQSGDKAYIDAFNRSVAAEGKVAVNGVDEAFMRKYSGYLKEFPELRKGLQDIADRNTAAKKGIPEIEKKQKSLVKALEQSQKGREMGETALTRSLEEVNRATDALKSKTKNTPVSRFAEDAEGRIETLLTRAKGDASTKELTELHEWAKAEGVQESFKAQVKQQLLNKLFPEDGRTGLVKASGRSIKAFDEIKDRLVESGVLAPADVKVIDDQLRGVVDKELARSKAGSMEVAPKISAKESALTSAAALALIASTGVPHALVAQSFTKKFLVSLLKEYKLSAKGQKKIADFMVNPEQYTEAYRILKAAQQPNGKISQEKMMDVIRAVTAVARTSDDEQ